MIVSDIEEQVRDLYGFDVSTSTISRITEAISNEVIAWQNRPLEEQYLVVWMDGIVFKVREALPENLVCVLGSVHESRPQLSIMLSDDMVKEHDLNAGKVIREAAKLIKGGGGGQPHYAQAGGKDADGISAAVEKVIELLSL